MGFTIDTSTDFGARAARRVHEDGVAWLTTTAADGTPQPNPVWFIWDDGAFLIFSIPNQAKVRNIERSGRAAFSFEQDPKGSIAIFTGVAEVVSRESVRPEVYDAFAAKYADGMASINYTQATFEEEYSTVIRLTPEKLRGW